MKNQKELKLSDNEESISNLDSYNAKKTLKKEIKK